MSTPRDLANYQRDVASVLFDADPAPALLRQGERDAWLVYRELSRSRMLESLTGAFPRTASLLGDTWPAFVASWLETAPPRELLVRGVIGEFGAWLESRTREDASVGRAPWCVALMRLERAILEVSWAEEPGARAGDVTEGISFDGIPVLAEVRRVLPSEWNVLALFEGDEMASIVPQKRDSAALVFRVPTTGLVETRALDAFSGELLKAIESAARPLKESVRVAAERSGRALDAALLEELSAELAEWVEIGFWVGTRGL